MKRCVESLLLVVLLAVPAQAHFVWIVPEGPGDLRAKVVFSDSLEPDENVAIDKIAGTKLLARDAAGKATPLEWKKGEHAYLLTLPGKEPLVVGGVCDYGVIKRGEGKPYRLAYYPKLVRGSAAAAKAWDKLPLEILPRGAGRFQVLFGGKPAAGAEVVVRPATGPQEKLRTDAHGECQAKSLATGLCGVRAKLVEAKPGELGGKKYEEARHYATLVVRVDKPQPAKSSRGPRFAPLPKAVSSLGAAVVDGYVYVYGGHSGQTHRYSTESVVGTFRRLKLSNPKSWEELPGGPAAQGLALVAHKGKLIRIGGMQPRNKPGDRSDNHSLATCSSYDPATRKWTALPDLPSGRSSHDATVVGDRIFVFGGWHMLGAGKKSEWYDTGLVLDLSAKAPKWEAVKQPFRRRALTAAAYKGKVYVLGGLMDEGEMELSVDVYDPAAGKWTSVKNIPGQIRNGFTPASCVAGGSLYLSTADGVVSRLAEKGDAWEPVGKLEHPRVVHRVVAHGDDLLVAIGGASRSGNVAVVEALELACCAEPKKSTASASTNPGGQTFCPVMTGVPVDGESSVVEYQGVKVLLCCRACVKKWNADPAAYLNARRLPQVAGLKLPGRSMEQVFCPVYRDRVVSEKDPFVMYKGKKIHLFNNAAVRRWNADPAQFADPAILPQLAAR
jgi:N-acetylneuraminic acid mutarotase/uncharacterized GH25 family protein